MSGAINVARLNGKTPAGEYVLHFGDTSFDPVQALRLLGYSSDDQAAVIRAFHLHYRGFDNETAGLDHEDARILHALLAKPEMPAAGAGDSQGK